MTVQTLTASDEVLQQIETLAKHTFLPIIGPERGEVLRWEIHHLRPRHVLEVGTLIGYSAILIGKELGSSAEMVTLEIHQDEAELANQNIQNAHLPAKIQVITGNALDVIPTLRGPFEFVFLDAEKNEYLQYLKLAEPKLATGAMVFADNAGIFSDVMADYLAYVRDSGKYRSRFVQIGDDAVEISIKQ
jgi:predicted O-methyltransferase YrrM